jgi:hypothetical protein
MTDEHPELAGYEPGDGRPLRDPRTLMVMRIVVVAGIAAIILPGVITTLAVGTGTAERACSGWVRQQRPEATGSDARFELFGPGGVGWQCYSVGAFGRDGLVASLGLIPDGSRLPITAP